MRSRPRAWRWRPGCLSGNSALRLFGFLTSLYARKLGRALAASFRERPLLVVVFVVVVAGLASAANYLTFVTRQLEGFGPALWALPLVAVLGLFLLARHVLGPFVRTVSPARHRLFGGTPRASQRRERTSVPFLLAYAAGLPALWLPVVALGLLVAFDLAAGSAGRLDSSKAVISQLWPLVFGFFWSNALVEIPRRFFRVARTRYPVLLLLHGVPPLLITLGTLFTPYGHPANLLTAAVWFLYWLSWDRPNLFHFLVFVVLAVGWLSTPITPLTLSLAVVAVFALVFRSRLTLQQGSLL